MDGEADRRISRVETVPGQRMRRNDRPGAIS